VEGRPELAAKSPARRRAAATVAGVERRSGPDDPRLPNLRRDLRATELEEHVRRIVDTFPPLTDEQRNKIAALLRPTGGVS
jgi:hypothetical protein